MIFSDQILEKFSGSSPLFPLPDFVLFPLTGYTFRIFEERYIEMVEDVLQNGQPAGLLLLLLRQCFGCVRDNVEIGIIFRILCSDFSFRF